MDHGWQAKRSEQLECRAITGSMETESPPRAVTLEGLHQGMTLTCDGPPQPGLTILTMNRRRDKGAMQMANQDATITRKGDLFFYQQKNERENVYTGESLFKAAATLIAGYRKAVPLCGDISASLSLDYEKRQQEAAIIKEMADNWQSGGTWQEGHARAVNRKAFGKQETDLVCLAAALQNVGRQVLSITNDLSETLREQVDKHLLDDLHNIEATLHCLSLMADHVAGNAREWQFAVVKDESLGDTRIKEIGNLVEETIDAGYGGEDGQVLFDVLHKIHAITSPGSELPELKVQGVAA